MRAIARFSLNCEAHEPPVQSTYLLYALLIAPARDLVPCVRRCCAAASRVRKCQDDNPGLAGSSQRIAE